MVEILSINLGQGFNLISVPLNLSKWKLGQEFLIGNPLPVTPVNSLSSIYRYNTNTNLYEKSDHFDNYGWLPASGSEDFTKLEPGKGYWVVAKNDCILNFSGNEPTTVSRYFNKYLNLIGWYSLGESLLGEESKVGNPLPVSPANSLTTIYRYNSIKQIYEKLDHINDWGWRSATGSEEFTKLEPGKGYWVLAKNSCILTTYPSPSGDTIRVYITDPISPNYNTVVTLDLESEYLPYVVAAENGAAPFESMKAQAVSSRTFAYYKKITSPRSTDFDVYDNVSDQVYKPYLDLDSYPNVRQSILDTKELVMKWGYRFDFIYPNECPPPVNVQKVIICSFYVSGSGSYEQYVTFNSGKSGECIDQTILGWVSNPSSLNPYNRGAMGQIQANSLDSDNGYTYDRILKYFYGDDIIIEQK